MTETKLVNYALRTDGVDAIQAMLDGGNNPNWVAAHYRVLADKLEANLRTAGHALEELGFYPSTAHCAFIREQGDREEALIQNLRDGANWIELTYRVVDPEGAKGKVWNLPQS